MKIGIISDTHDHIPHIQKAVELFREKEVDLVIHAGDYCSPFTIPYFKNLNLKGIFGNNDGDRYLLMKKFDEIGAELAGEFYSTELDGIKIAVYHGTYEEITQSLIESGNFDVVVSGHTHERVHKVVGETLVINPGTAHGFDGKPTIAILETITKKVEFLELK